MVKSLVELVDGIEDGNNSVLDILVTLENYATAGAHISPDIVCKIIDGHDLTPDYLDAIYESMEGGLARQIAQGQAPEAFNYLQVMNHIAQHMADSGKLPDMVRVYFSYDPEISLLKLLKAQLLVAHTIKDRAMVDQAIATFKTYARRKNPSGFEEGAQGISAVPGSVETYTPGFMSGSGNPMTAHKYLDSITSDDKLRIISAEQAPAKTD